MQKKCKRYLKIKYKKKILNRNSTSIELNGPYEIKPKNIEKLTTEEVKTTFLFHDNEKITLMNNENYEQFENIAWNPWFLSLLSAAFLNQSAHSRVPARLVAWHQPHGRSPLFF